jgi:hypothetical protein
LRLKCSLSVKLAMLRGKEIPYHLDGHDNLIEARNGPNQGTWYDKERGEFVTGKAEPRPNEQGFHSYTEFPAYHWK